MSGVVVVGAGVSGLGTALALARGGHEVTLLERDRTPTAASPSEAFEWDRRGAPQVRHSHAFLARLRNLLRDHYPDVYGDLLAAGVTEMRFGDALPPTLEGFVPQADDTDLVMLACRRTTFEWVLRRAVLAEGRVTIRDGVAVEGLLTGGVAPRAPRSNGAHGSTPRVTGVRVDGGRVVDADTVVVANGRRSALPAWLAEIGVPGVVEETEDTGIVYFSRFYRLLDGYDLPPRSGAIGGDLGYLKYGVFLGDDRTFSITLATPTDDAVLRRRLTEAEVFDSVARTLVATAAYLDGRATPITGVHTMAGLLNRWRELAPEGRPLALGVHAVGDARVCTNPLYGRGCSTSFWHAHLLAEAIAAHPNDAMAQAQAHDAATTELLAPWYRATVVQDAEARRIATALLAGQDPDGDPNDPRTFMRSVLREGLLPALRYDAVVLRAFFRNFNLLSAPDALLTDPEVQTRVLAVWEGRAGRPAEEPLGPPRHDLLALIEPEAA